jgi:hypothetical protein
MNRAGRAMLVRYVLCAMPVHLLIAISVPKWFIKTMDKIRRGSYGKEKKRLMEVVVLWLGRRS